MRWIAPVVTVLALIAAACGDTGGDAAETTDTAPADDSAPPPDDSGTDGTDGDGSTDTTTTSTPARLTASWPGVTETSIRIGFLEVDLETLVELELIDNYRGDPRVVVDALVAELNDRGGILGREIEVFYENVLPINTADAEAACQRLTEDDDVFAVLGSFVGPTVGVDPCISDLGETIMIGGNPTPDDLARARAPWLSTGMALGRRLPAVVQLQHDAGILHDPLAVVWAVEDENAARDLVLPRLAELGHDVAVEAVQLADAGDRRALASEWQNFLERFRVSGVETVLLVQQSAGINGPSQLAELDYEGDIALVASSVLASIGVTAQVPLEELAGINGSMGPSIEEAYALPATQACVDILEAAHPEITVVPPSELADGETDWGTPLLTHCTRLRLFELIATAAGADLTHESFLAAAERLGELELPGNPFTSLGPGKLDVSDSLRLAVFDPEIGQFGGAGPVGDLTRVPG